MQHHEHAVIDADIEHAMENAMAFEHQDDGRLLYLGLRTCFKKIGTLGMRPWTRRWIATRRRPAWSMNAPDAPPILKHVLSRSGAPLEVVKVVGLELVIHAMKATRNRERLLSGYRALR